MPKDVKGVMKEYAEGKLHSGAKNGPVVKNRKQAIAIAMSEQRQLQGKPEHPKKRAGRKLTEAVAGAMSKHGAW